MSHVPYALGFASLQQEIELPELDSQGHIPDWLHGNLVRTGPAKFEVESQAYNHWFDGLAMLHKFSFANGRVGYANRYLRGQSYTDAMRHKAIQRSEFATDPQRGPLQKLLPFMQRDSGDNGNVNIERLGTSLVALTETPTPLRFDPEDLATQGAFRYQDDLAGQVTTAHPLFDSKRDRLYNFLVEFGRNSQYHLYSIAAGSAQRERIASIPVQQPAYMHSFGMSERYLVLTEFPLVVNPLRLLMGQKPYIENYRWQPERGTVFHVIDKDNGQVVKTVRSDAFFAFHHVNAFEQSGELCVDIVVFPDASVVDQLYLSHLRSGRPVTVIGRLKRFRIGLGAEDGITSELLVDSALEFPRFNEAAHAMQPYRYVYGAAIQNDNSFIDSVVKLDLDSGATTVWQAQDCYPGEPVFVAAPQAAAEDQGVILSVVLDAGTGASFLLVLDAQTFSELARAQLPHHIPFGFHGNYFERSGG